MTGAPHQGALRFVQDRADSTHETDHANSTLQSFSESRRILASRKEHWLWVNGMFVAPHPGRMNLVRASLLALLGARAYPKFLL